MGEARREALHTRETLGEVKVVLVDACPVVRFGLGAMIRAEGASVVGETGLAEGALDLVRSARPGYVILDPDIERDEPSGTCLCEGVKSLPDPPCVVVYTSLDSFADLASFMLSGVDHYVHKGTDRTELAEIASRIHAGESVWRLGAEDSDASRKLLATAKVGRLTFRERQILRLLLRGHANRRIAEKLHISLSTTKSHVGHVLRKLDCGKRGDLFSI